jgi:TonB family protein
MAEKKDKSFITTGEKLRNFLGWGFVLSLVINALATPFYPNLAQHREDQEVEKVAITKKIKVKVPTPPPPSPTPPPTPTPAPKSTPPPKKVEPKPQPKLKLNVVKTTSNKASSSTEAAYNAPAKGSEEGAPAGVGNSPGPPAAPAATAKPACANPNQDATVTQPMSPDYPESAKSLGLGPVTVLVEVSVGPSGNLVDAKVYKSSNNMAIDQAALRAARQSSYAPKLVNCSPTTGDYIFRAEFNPDQ